MTVLNKYAIVEFLALKLTNTYCAVGDRDGGLGMRRGCQDGGSWLKLLFVYRGFILNKG